MCAQRTRLEWVDCHRKPERSFFWKGKQFPLCARCTGIYGAFILFPFFSIGFFKIDWLWSLLLMVPTIVDGLTQAYYNRESNNIIRVTTGIAAGIGMVSYMVLTGNLIGKFLLNLFN
ncbi:MAG: DUF2085 domain-containing protein [Nonlabens sp.]|uniref:DUF2085 domain-containing protein n=1 Tax=Nonlabens sp. TaxID=1888209 RepID=UPI003EF354AC